jgi:hypothetical protein
VSVIGEASRSLWRAAITLLLLLTIGTLASQRTDFDLDLHPAPFSAYDDDIIRTSLGLNRNAPDLMAVWDAAGGKGKLPVPLSDTYLPAQPQLSAASTSGPTWLVLSAARAITGTSGLPYLPRGPPAA